MKKILAIVLSITLVLGITITVYAHDWPGNIDDWTWEDWEAWNNYWESWDWDEWQREQERQWEEECKKEWERQWEEECRKEWEKEWEKSWEHACDWDYYNWDWENCDYYDWDWDYNWDWNHDWDWNYRHHHRLYDPNYGKTQENPCGNINNYSGYNFYAGILDVYDGSTEDQAAVLARIMAIYAHGTPSQTAQACVGWAVMNSVDASPRGTTICDVAPNFGYDYNALTIDDFGRDLTPLARDIIFRWKAGRAGISNNGRVLPSGYCYVWSNGSILTFRTTPNESGTPWNYSAATPYGS